MSLSDCLICELDSLDSLVPLDHGVLAIVRCPTSELPTCPISLPPERIATECLSLVTTEGVTGEAILPLPPLPQPFLEFLRLAQEPYLREAAQLWGLIPDQRIHFAWQDFLQLTEASKQPVGPIWAQKLIQRGLALWDGQAVYLPLPVLAAITAPTPAWDLKTLHLTLQWIRRQLAATAVQESNATTYRNFTAFLLDPRCETHELLLYRCVNLPSIALNGESPGTWLLPAARAFCATFRQQDPETYRQVCAAQRPIWEAFGEAIRGLSTILKDISLGRAPAREGDYDTSCRGARSALDQLACAFYELGRFERRMGVDRYMAPALVKADLDTLHDLVRQVRRQANRRLEPHRLLFQRDWGNFRIADIVRRLFGQIPADPFNSRFPTNQRRVILFVMDGFGYVQYRWNRLMAQDRRQTTFGGSVLDFLAEQEDYCDTWILGAPLVTDTGAGLAQIFSGLPSRKNGVYSSHLSDGRGGFFDVKRIQTQEEWDQRVGGSFPVTFFDRLEKVHIQVLTSGASSKPSAFAQRNWGNHPVEAVDPPERFAQVLLQHLQEPNNRRQLYVVYYPLIDRHGHSLGSFSSFELHEYERLNHLLSSLLLQLLSSRPDLFDGQTTMVLTADHGMFESAGGTVTLDEVTEKLQAVGMRRPRVTMANRAIFLYGIRPGELHATEQALRELLRSKHMEAKFISRDQGLYRELVYEGEDFQPRLPDLIVLLQDEGLAIPRPINTPYLHYGGHGGCSAEEVFVPCVTIVLTPRLVEALSDKYGRLT